MELTNLISAGSHPANWDLFIGQSRGKVQLKMKAASARKRNAVMGHVLLFSPEPGIGKTSLALLTAQEMGRKVDVVSSKLDRDEFHYHLTKLSDGDVIVWDEAQQQFPKGAAGRKQWEWMLNYMQHGTLTDEYGSVQAVPRVTLIFASTDFGLIPQTITDRIETIVELVPYTEDEQIDIACALAGRIMRGLPMPDVATAAAVAAAANGKPRIMTRMLQHLTDQANADAVTPYDNGDGSFGYDLSMVLDWEGVTVDGLSSLAQKFLTFMYDVAKMAPVGLEQITEHLREDKLAVREVERILVDKQYVTSISRGKPGRKLTPMGIERAKELASQLQGVEVGA